MGGFAFDAGFDLPANPPPTVRIPRSSRSFWLLEDALFQYLRSAGYKLLHYQEDEHKTGVAIFEQSAWPPQSN